MDRKIVKPAQKGGMIWNPDHHRFVPDEGIEVQMTPYWLHLVARGDVTAEKLPDPPPAKPVDPQAAKTSAKPAATV